ncbi:unnamed protein product [Closterium sp. Yama58-4]|nr:unnamed protein product [Closterium sp. Yama58-4]
MNGMHGGGEGELPDVERKAVCNGTHGGDGGEKALQSKKEEGAVEKDKSDLGDECANGNGGLGTGGKGQMKEGNGGDAGASVEAGEGQGGGEREGGKVEGDGERAGGVEGTVEGSAGVNGIAELEDKTANGKTEGTVVEDVKVESGGVVEGVSKGEIESGGVVECVSKGGDSQAKGEDKNVGTTKLESVGAVEGAVETAGAVEGAVESAGAVEGEEGRGENGKGEEGIKEEETGANGKVEGSVVGSMKVESGGAMDGAGVVGDSCKKVKVEKEENGKGEEGKGEVEKGEEGKEEDGEEDRKEDEGVKKSKAASGSKKGRVSGGVARTAVAPAKVILPPQTMRLTMLDMYSGCGAMSTGIEMGGTPRGVTIDTCWSVDFNAAACESMRYNHPLCQVRNETADEFLAILQELPSLLERYGAGSGGPGGPRGSGGPGGSGGSTAAAAAAAPAVLMGAGGEKAGRNKRQKGNGAASKGSSGTARGKTEEEDEESSDEEIDEGEFEVERIAGVRYIAATEKGRPAGIYFKVQWKGYGPEEDTWEAEESLSSCKPAIRDYLVEVKEKKLLPLPGDVDIICGGPPCQGVSGFNRFRNTEDPLACEKNRQLVVFMDLVAWLAPKWVLMENVVDLMKFKEGILAKYAIARLVAMGYKSRTGIIAAGCFGVAQFRLRAFFFGALNGHALPSFPLPTHLVAKERGCVPTRWMRNFVGWEERSPVLKTLKPALVLKDVISDLPPVTNATTTDVMDYTKPPANNFQRFIRLPKSAFRPPPPDATSPTSPWSWDANPKLLDHRTHNLNADDFYRVERIPKREKILHPEQDRVLTVRENARLQGFPDHYKLFGDAKERYCQVGNAVSVPTAMALGYSIAGAALGGTSTATYGLPSSFPYFH